MTAPWPLTQICWYGVILDFAIELVTENDHVLAVARKKLLIGISRIPDSRLAHEIEPGTMDNGGTLSLSVCSEEDGRAEDPLKGRDQTAILRAALLHREGVQHLRGTF